MSTSCTFRGLICRHSLGLAAAFAAAVTLTALASGQDKYEVWAIDQSNSPGTTFGGTLYIWDGHDLENRHRAETARADTIDLGGAAAAMCLARTGANPIRPHMIAMNPSQTHAIISFVASGHVLFMDAATRVPVGCLRMSVGAGGARQAHMSSPSPDETYVTVANQNGKLFERILTDYATNTFVHDTAATLNLATCMTPNGLPCEGPLLRPDNAPICPIPESTSRFVFVTLRGGGLFVVNGRATPMAIVGEYDNVTVHGNGCLGAEVPGKMYIDSGGGTAANLHQADLYAFPTTGYSAANLPNTPAPTLVFSDPSEETDAHGAALTKHGKYLWVADRGRNFLWGRGHEDRSDREHDPARRSDLRRPNTRSASGVAKRQPRVHVATRSKPAHGGPARQHRQHAWSGSAEDHGRWARRRVRDRGAGIEPRHGRRRAG